MLRALAIVAVCACHPPSQDEWQRQGPEDYAAARLWLCRPDLPGDACHGDLSTTELHADGTRAIVKRAAAVDPQVDCFYVYPTVDLGLRAGNHTDFANLDRMRKTARAQFARFAQTCRMYAPLYRQVTIGTYFADDETQERFFAVAYSDVAAAFHYYLEHDNHGRRLVVIGHSQGAQMVEKLLADTVDRDDALRRLLVVAMPIGFHVTTPTGLPVGGSFQHLAPCTTDAQAGCIVAYRSLAIGDQPDPSAWPLEPGRQAVCVEPAGGGQRPLHAVFPSDHSDVAGLTTPYVSYPDFYQARCVTDPGGRDFLEISEIHATGDQRVPPLNLAKHHGGLGLHIFDFQLPQDDLIELVKTKLAAMK